MELGKKLPAFYRKYNFVTAFTTATTCPYPKQDQ
jgi:uncharacterized protein (DUF1684 family)